MELPLFLRTIEETGISTWIRESPSLWAFPLILTAHTFGLVLLVGPSAMIDLRLLGFAPDVPLAPLKRLFKFMWVGFWLNAASGLVLLFGYPTKALTNPMFYIKLTLIGLAMFVLLRIRNRVFGDGEATEAAIAQCRNLAIYSLCLWVAVITAGRLLAYTYSWLLYGSPGSA